MTRSATPVPGPPRARRRTPGGELGERIERMRAAETGGAGFPVGALLRLLRDVILLVKDLIIDPRVPARAKVVPAAIAGAYVLSPVGLVGERVAVLRHVDDVLVVCWAVRRLLRAAGYERIYEVWRGSATGLTVVLHAAGVE